MALDLDAIKARCADAATRGHLTRLHVEEALIDTDVPELVAEAERLRAEGAALAESMHDLLIVVRARSVYLHPLVIDAAELALARFCLAAGQQGEMA